MNWLQERLSVFVWYNSTVVEKQIWLIFTEIYFFGEMHLKLLLIVEDSQWEWTKNPSVWFICQPNEKNENIFSNQYTLTCHKQAHFTKPKFHQNVELFCVRNSYERRNSVKTVFPLIHLAVFLSNSSLDNCIRDSEMFPKSHSCFSILNNN